MIHQAAGERNYHSFYALCAGASSAERAALFLPPEGTGGPSAPAAASAFRLLTHGQCLRVEGIHDAEDYTEMKKAFLTLQFSAIDVQEIMKTVAAILHLSEGGTTQHTQRTDEQAATVLSRVRA